MMQVVVSLQADIRVPLPSLYLHVKISGSCRNNTPLNQRKVSQLSLHLKFLSSVYLFFAWQ